MKEITADQYRQLSQIEGTPTEEQLIQILFGKPKNKMTLSEIKALDFTGFQMPEATLTPNLVYHDGVLYGRQDMQNLTFGLYIDLVEQAKDLGKNMILIMTMLWRPVTKISYWNRAKAYVAHKLLISKNLKLQASGLRLINKVKYEIEPYDVLKCFGREDTFKELPGSVAAYTTTFFLTTSEVLLLNSLRSLKQDLQKKAEDLQESLKRISQDGDGTPISGSSQEKEQSK